MSFNNYAQNEYIETTNQLFQKPIYTNKRIFLSKLIPTTLEKILTTNVTAI